nr:winged helix-turn-helix domain-containing protein [uncultured Methanolobus sp.]
MVKKNKMIKVVGNETRVRIMESLSFRDKHIAEIASELGISCTSISKHIRVLEEAQLIERKIFGKSHVLSLSNKQNEGRKNIRDSSDLELYIIDNLFLI